MTGICMSIRIRSKPPGAEASTRLLRRSRRRSGRRRTAPAGSAGRPCGWSDGPRPAARAAPPERGVGRARPATARPAPSARRQRQVSRHEGRARAGRASAAVSSPPISSASVAGDGQAQARAAEAAGDRAVGLLEAVEQAAPACSASKPMPVSVTSKRTPAVAVRPRHAAVTAHRARVGELHGVGDRLARIWRTRTASPTTSRSSLGSSSTPERQALVLGAGADRAAMSADRLAQVRRARPRAPLAGLDPAPGRGCRRAAAPGSRPEAAISLDHARAARRVEVGLRPGRRPCPARRSAACGSRGSCWPGTRSWRGWRPRPRHAPRRRPPRRAGGRRRRRWPTGTP